MHGVFEKYIPKFEYELIDQNKYSVGDLTQYGDLLSLFMILNKIKKPDELNGILTRLPEDYIEHLRNVQ